jgi:probable rRNA maturation factor
LIKKKYNNSDTSSSLNILINNSYPSEKLPFTYQDIRTIVKGVIDGEHNSIDNLELSFVNDKEIRKINKLYLKHDYYTDILSFTYGSGNGLDAEMIISLDSVKKNAKTYLTSYKNELKRVIIHGCLHLSGYNDRTVKEKENMKTKENFYIEVFKQ